MKNERKITYDFEAKKQKGLPLGELKKLLEKWQGKLGMTDWKMDLKIVDFWNKNGYRQSGDFVADPEQKTATILLTWDPWRGEDGDEEYTLVHEMIHVLLYDYDKFAENLIAKHHDREGREFDFYFDKLEKLTEHLTKLVLGRPGK